MSTKALRWIICRTCGKKSMVQNRAKHCDNCYKEFQKKMGEVTKDGIINKTGE